MHINFKTKGVAKSLTHSAVTITPKTLTVTVNNVSVTKEYDGTRDAPTGFSPTLVLLGYSRVIVRLV